MDSANPGLPPPGSDRVEPTSKRRAMEQPDGDDAATKASAVVADSKPPFTITYPTVVKTRSPLKRHKMFTKPSPDPEAQANRAEDQFELPFVVKPKGNWEKLRRYRSFRVGDEKIRTDEYVFVNNSGEEGKQGEEAHGEQHSAEHADFRNYWVAQVKEVAAMDGHHVYIRVLWLYWPEELPGGAQPYHGQSELVLSNHMDIIDALAVAGRARVRHWAEHDEDDVPGGLFWRQQYTFHNEAVSDLRKHCICREHHNPDTILVWCNNARCKVWLHEECLLRDVLSRAYGRLMEKEEEEEEKKRAKEKAKLDRPDGNTTPRTPKSSPIKRRRGRPPKEPWKGILEAHLPRNVDDDDAPRDTTLTAIVTDVRRAVDGHGDGDAGQHTWSEDLYCLMCHSKIE